MFPKNFIYQRFHFPFIYILAIHITLSQLTYILNLICGAKIDGKIEGKQIINRMYRYHASTSHVILNNPHSNYKGRYYLSFSQVRKLRETEEISEIVL